MKLLISGNSESFVEKCAICLQDIISDGIQHEICTSKFHRDHLASWFIHNNQNCPYCKYPFQQKIIQDLNPKSKDELDRLKKIAEVFGAPSKREIIPSRSRKKRLRKSTPKIVHEKWELYFYRSVYLVPTIIAGVFWFGIVIFPSLKDPDGSSKIFSIALGMIFFSLTVIILKTEESISKKVIYLPKIV